VGFEEVGDFGLAVWGIGAVNSVFVDGEGEVSAKGAGFGIFGIGCSHEVAVFFWMAFSLREQDQNGAGNHERTRSWKKGRFLCTA